jgi:hypothetical protein
LKVTASSSPCGAPAGDGEDLAADLPDMGAAPLDDMGCVGAAEARAQKALSASKRAIRGSRWRWGQTTRFRLEEGGWLMTGMTELQHDSIYNSVIEYDYNALTYKIAVTVDEGVDDPEAEPVCVACRAGEACGSGDCYKTTKPAKTGTTWFDTPRRDRVTLSGFRCWFEQTGLLEHTGFQVRR